MESKITDNTSNSNHNDISNDVALKKLREKIKGLRKVDPKKAQKFQKRLKLRQKKLLGVLSKKNKTKQQTLPQPSTYNGTSGLLSAGDESEGGDTNEDDYIPRTFEEELEDLSSDIVENSNQLSEINDVFQRYITVQQTRASGKGGGGGMEDYGLECDFENDDDQYNRLGMSSQNGKEKYSDEDDEDEDGNIHINRHGLSKKKLKQLRRPTVSQLKQICARPEVIESWDTTAPDAPTLVYLKAHRNTVPVPPHWSHKRRYLQGKRGLEKSQFNLPHYIEATRISEIRSAIEEKDSKKTLKQRMREKVRPRHRKMNIDYQTLHDAFFKYATKPIFTQFGDVYFEGKETEMQFRRYTPGKLSTRCRDGLGMTSALDAPPWLLNMQRYGPPPSYPNLVVPGVNAHLPEGAALGFQPGGWGKPPGLEQLKIWGVTPRFEEVVLGEDDLEGLDGGDGGLWGQLQTLESEDDKYEDDKYEDDLEHDDISMTTDPSYLHHINGISGIDTPHTVDGNSTPITLDPTGLLSIVSLSGLLPNGMRTITNGGGVDSVSSGIDTPQSIDLRRSGFGTDGTPKPYTILERTKAPAQPGALFSSESIYTLPSIDQSSSSSSSAMSHNTSSLLGGTVTPLG